MKPHTPGLMTPEQARDTYALLYENSVKCWVMGGWGVDALLGRITRTHKDLDLLVNISDLPHYSVIIRNNGFDRKLEWSENQQISVGTERFDSAFVDAHPDGREIDVHVIDVDTQGAIVQFHTDPWPLPVDALTGIGVIEGMKVRCVSRAAQIAMHSVYEMPEKHRDDINLLKENP